MSPTFTLTSEQRDAFERDGVICLKSWFPSEAVERARAAVLRRLASIGLWRDGAWRLEAAPTDRRLKAREVIGNRHPELAELCEAPRVLALVDELLAGREVGLRFHPRPQVLFTLPSDEPWALPNTWHTDGPRLASGRTHGVQLFTFLETVEPRGGGTMAVAGSHKLLNGRTLLAKRMRRELLAEPFFRQLWSGTPIPWADEAELPSGVVANHPLRVLEMTGEPGDLWLTDMRVFHTGSPNVRARPRLMVTRRFVATDVAREIEEAHGWV